MASGSSSSSTSSTFRPNPNIPIPNNPFYFPESSFLRGDLGQLIVGSGLSVDYATGVLSSTGGGGGGAVNQVTGGAGITVSPTTGNVVVANSGVLQLTAGTGVSITGTKTNYTISSPYFGTVTSITAGTGLTGGIITTAGTLAIDGNVVLLKSLFTAKGQLLASTASNAVTTLSSGGSPNGYLLTLDSAAATGMKWAAAPTAIQSLAATAPIQTTAGVNPIISVTTATTSASGVTTLVNDVATNDPTKALTAAQGYALQQQINSLTGAGGLTLAGTLNAATGNLVTVTANGAGAGFSVGAPLPAAAVGNTDYFVIVTTGGTYTPPGGSSVTASQGDWFNSTGTAWSYLNVGYDAPNASTTVAGIVQLATNTEAITGTDSDKALTPLSGTCAFIPRSCLTAKGTLVSATTALAPSPLAVGLDGQVLTACSSCATGLTWATASIPAIPCACITAKGDVLTGTGASSPIALSVGTNGQFLAADSTATTGLTWCTPSYVPCSAITGKGALITGTAASTPTALAVGTNGQILSADSAAANGLTWCTPTYIPCALVTAKGGVIGASANGTPAFLGAAVANGCLLASNSTCTTGLEWIAPPAAATPFVQGLVKGCTTGSFTSLGCTTGVLVTGTNSTYLGANILYVGFPITSGCDTFVGACVGGALGVYRTGSCNTVVGACALYYMGDNTRGNTALGAGIHNCAGNTLTGSNNLILSAGTGINVPVNSGSCQLAIGFSVAGLPQVSCYWLTGSSDKTIRPGAGIIDCVGSAGIPRSPSSGSVLYSMGAAGVCWGDPPAAALFCRGGIFGCSLTSSTALGYQTGQTASANSFTCAFCADSAVIVGVCSGIFQNNLRNTTMVGGNIYCQGFGSSMSHPNNTYVGAHIGCNANYTCILDNVIVGAFAGTSNNGSGHTVLGACAGQTMDASTTNNIAIGFNAQPSTSTVSNTITLGNSSITTIRAAVTSITAISDARDKTAVHDLAIGLDFVNDLHPVEFTWARREPNPVKDGTRESGFLAQEVSQVVKDHLASDYLHLVNEENPDQLEIAPSTLIPVLVKALQQLSEKHEKLAEEFSNYVRSHP